jgi:hypothetical protein
MGRRRHVSASAVAITGFAVPRIGGGAEPDRSSSRHRIAIVRELRHGRCQSFPRRPHRVEHFGARVHRPPSGRSRPHHPSSYPTGRAARASAWRGVRGGHRRTRRQPSRTNGTAVKQPCSDGVVPAASRTPRGRLDRLTARRRVARPTVPDSATRNATASGRRSRDRTGDKDRGPRQRRRGTNGRVQAAVARSRRTEPTEYREERRRVCERRRWIDPVWSRDLAGAVTGRCPARVRVSRVRVPGRAARAHARRARSRRAGRQRRAGHRADHR